MEAREEIRWITKSIYVDIDTGEIIGKDEVIRNYLIINKTKKTNVYKATGTITHTNECRRTPQIKIEY